MIGEMIVRHVRLEPIVRPSFLLEFHSDLSAGHTQLSPNPTCGTFDGFPVL